MEVKLSYNCGRYHLCFVYIAEKAIKPPKETAMIALDLGVRTFQTEFDNNGHFCKIGDQAMGQILTRGMKMDKLYSTVSKLHKNNCKDQKDRVHHKNLRRKFRKQIEHCQHRLQNRI